MKFKGIEVTGEFTLHHNDKYKKIYKNGNLVYKEYLDGYWKKWEYDNNNKAISFEDNLDQMMDKKIDSLIENEQIIKIKENK